MSRHEESALSHTDPLDDPLAIPELPTPPNDYDYDVYAEGLDEWWRDLSVGQRSYIERLVRATLEGVTA